MRKPTDALNQGIIAFARIDVIRRPVCCTSLQDAGVMSLSAQVFASHGMHVSCLSLGKQSEIK